MENSSRMHLTSMKCILISLFLFTSCDFMSDAVPELNQEVVESPDIIRPEGTSIKTRFETPEGFVRTKDSPGVDFASYLRSLPLHPQGKKVELYNGSLKGNQNAQAAVIKMDVGSRDLQQCADAVMRLRAEYLYKQKKYEELHFNFTNGFNAKYSTWRSGKGISIKGNNVRWVNSSASNSSYASFRKYMDKVFMFAGTASLEKELKLKDIKDIQAGDVFIRGGHPGHAVIVVDVCVNKSGQKAFMLAQSYMPAQEIHILKNPSNATLSPWYLLSEIVDAIETPEWTFYKNQLRSFP